MPGWFVSVGCKELYLNFEEAHASEAQLHNIQTPSISIYYYYFLFNFFIAVYLQKKLHVVQTC